MHKHLNTLLILLIINLFFLTSAHAQVIIDPASDENVNQLLSYTVQEGDSLSVLADRYLIPVKELQ